MPPCLTFCEFGKLFNLIAIVFTVTKLIKLVPEIKQTFSESKVTAWINFISENYRNHKNCTPRKQRN